MFRSPLTRLLILLVCGFAPACGSLGAQIAPPASKQMQLQFVVVLTRHGVRSPTGDPGRFAKYSRAPWPQWDVPPGYLTAHGFEDMKLFGAWDRSQLAQEGLLSATGCADSAQVWFYADSDQRTRESGRALTEGMFPAVLLRSMDFRRARPTSYFIRSIERPPTCLPLRLRMRLPSPPANS